MAKPNRPPGWPGDDLGQLLREVRAALERLTKPSADDVQLQILAIVKDIRKHQKGGGGLNPAEEAALAEQLGAASDPLKAAVEANQP